MKQENRVLPLVGLCLHFCCMNLFLAGMTVGGETVLLGKELVAMHFGLVPLCALLFMRLLRPSGPRGSTSASTAGAKRPLVPALLLACAATASLVTGFILTPERLGVSLVLPVVCMALCLPVGLTLYFQSSRPGGRGLALGLAVSSGELVWIVLLPILSAVFATSSSGETMLLDAVAPAMAAHIYSLLCFFQAGSGLCFTMALLTTTPDAPRPNGNGATASFVLPAAARKVLLLLFAAGVTYFSLFGMAFLFEMPRMTVNPESPGRLHFFLLVSAPLAGLLADRSFSRPSPAVPDPAGKLHPGCLESLYLALSLAALMAPLAGLPGQESGSLAGVVLVLLNMAREALLVVLYVCIYHVARRAAGWTRRLPLLLSLAYSLYLVQFFSAPLGRALVSLTASRAPWLVLEFGLAAGFSFCLWRLSRHLSSSWELTSFPEHEEPSGPFAADIAKLASFAVAFDLTSREAEVLEGILAGLDNAAMGERLGISERTVRHHLGGVLAKTDKTNRKRLLRYYISWQA